MSVYDAARPVPLGAITTLRIVSFVERAVDAFVTWRNARATVSVLRGLSDQQLEDIGLYRGQIRALADKLARN